MIILPRRWKWVSLLLAGGILLSMVTGGLAAAAPSSASGGTVFLRTVPPLGGVRIQVGGQAVTTGPDGSVSMTVNDLNGIASQVGLATSQLGNNTLTLAKVQPGSHVPHESRLTLGLDVSTQLSLQINPGDTGVAASMVRSVRLHSSAGDRIDVDPRVSPYVSLSSRRARLQNGVLRSQIVTWSVDSVKAGPGVALTAQNQGFDPFGQSTWSLDLQAVRGTVVVDTVPRTAGVVFFLEGATITTGENGRGTGVVGDLNGVADRIRLKSPQAGPSSVSLMRIAKLPPGAHFHRHLLAVLAVRRPVSLSFRDASGAPVPPDRIKEVRLEGGGSTVILKGSEIGQPVSLLAGVATQVNRVWEPRQLTYAVAAVHLDGSNAVFAGKQRFNPTISRTWPISVAVFNLKVTVHDAIFGNTISTSVWVTRPDGARYRVKLGAGASTLTSLVRGNYDLEALSAVYGSHTKLLVSRNDKVDLRVITRLDLVAMILAVVAVAVAVVMLGRYLRILQLRRSAVDDE